MAFQYTRSQLLLDINAEIRGKIGMISSQQDFINRVVREVNNDIAIRSTKRKQTLTPDLVQGIFQYACPTDLNDARIIDIPAQAKRYDGTFGLVPIVQFRVNPKLGDIAFDDYNGVRLLMINSAVTNESVTPSTLETTTSGGGTWTAVGDATNVRNDGDDFIKGNGSVAFDIGSGATTTAGLQNTALNQFDITDFLGGHSSVFVWVRISSITNLTNFVLRIGSSSGNYYTKTVTTANDGGAFQVGWNLLRFPLVSLTEVGSVTDTAINFAYLVMTKTSAKINETEYKFNWMTIIKGFIHDVQYYSKYGWQSAAGTYLENSTNSLDLLVADTSEYDLFVKYGASRGHRLTNGNINDIQDADNQYKEAVIIYGNKNVDESAIMISTYQNQ